MSSMDTSELAALARMVRARARRLERDAYELRGLASKLLDTIEASDTQEDTEHERSNGAGYHTPAAV